MTKTHQPKEISPSHSSTLHPTFINHLQPPNHPHNQPANQPKNRSHQIIKQKKKCCCLCCLMRTRRMRDTCQPCFKLETRQAEGQLQCQAVAWETPRPPPLLLPAQHRDTHFSPSPTAAAAAVGPPAEAEAPGGPAVRQGQGGPAGGGEYLLLRSADASAGRLLPQPFIPLFCVPCRPWPSQMQMQIPQATLLQPLLLPRGRSMTQPSQMSAWWSGRLASCWESELPAPDCAWMMHCLL